VRDLRDIPHFLANLEKILKKFLLEV